MAVSFCISSSTEWVSVASHPHWHLVSSVFCIPAILIGVWWYISVILICSFLRMCDVEHLFILFLPCVCILGESISVQIFCPFLNWVFLPLKKNWSIVDIQCCVSFRYTYCWVFKSSFYILGNSPLSCVFLNVVPPPPPFCSLSSLPLIF